MMIITSIATGEPIGHLPMCVLPTDATLFHGTSVVPGTFVIRPNVWLAFDRDTSIGYGWYHAPDIEDAVPIVAQLRLRRTLQRIIDVPPHPCAESIMPTLDCDMDLLTMFEASTNGSRERRAWGIHFDHACRVLSYTFGVDCTGLATMRITELEQTVADAGFDGYLLRGEELNRGALMLCDPSCLEVEMTHVITNGEARRITVAFDEWFDAFDRIVAEI